MTRTQSIAAGLSGAVLGLAGGYILAAGAFAVVDDPVIADDVDPLHAIGSELVAIRNVIERAEASPPPERMRRSEIDPGGGSLVDALHALERAMRTAEAERNPEPASRDLPRRRVDEDPRATDVDAVRTARAALPANRNQPEPELFGLSPGLVYRRFGTPTHVFNSNNRIVWQYDDPQSPATLSFTFIGGYVAWINNDSGE